VQSINRARGVALLTAIMTLAVIAGIAALIFARMLSEMRHSRDDAAITQTLLLARGAANVGAEVLSSRVRDTLKDAISQYADSTSPWAFGVGGNGQEPDPASVASALSLVAARMQSAVDADLCGKNFAPNPGQERATIRIYFTTQACGKPLPRNTRLGPGHFIEGRPRGSGASYTQTYALPFVAVAEGRVGPYKRSVVAQGEFRFTVGRASFARYALFTNVHAMPDGTGVWFTDRTLFDGPVHTNNHFRFYRTPWFGGEVSSAGCTFPGDTGCRGSLAYGARFYGEGFVQDTAMTPSPQAPSYRNAWGRHAPEFTHGVDWRAPFIPLPINNQAQQSAALAQGIYIDRDVLDLRLFTEKVGDKLYQHLQFEVCTAGYWTWVWDWNSGWVRTLVCTNRQTLSYRYDETKTLQVYQPSSHRWVNVVRDGSPVRFNGVVFANGKIRSLKGPERTDPDDPDSAAPALAPFAQITIAAQDTIRITGDLKYTDRPCSSYPHRDRDGNVVPATCENLGALNVLGIYSQNGNVLIGANAPRDINIDGVLMSARGVVQVEGYDTIPEKGYVHLTGGIIEYFYGAFGTFNPRTGRNQTGYGRRFTYDPRMKVGLAPPFFPTTQLDTVLDIEAFSFGQREQVY